MKPFLILQLRPETEASDNEFQAMLRKSGLSETDIVNWTGSGGLARNAVTGLVFGQGLLIQSNSHDTSFTKSALA